MLTVIQSRLTIARTLFAINTERYRQRLYYQTDETHYRHHLMYYAISLILSNIVKLSYNKLGYNELGYNKLPVITSRFFSFLSVPNTCLLYYPTWL